LFSSLATLVKAIAKVMQHKQDLLIFPIQPVSSLGMNMTKSTQFLSQADALDVWLKIRIAIFAIMGS